MSNRCLRVNPHSTLKKKTNMPVRAMPVRSEGLPRAAGRTVQSRVMEHPSRNADVWYAIRGEGRGPRGGFTLLEAMVVVVVAAVVIGLLIPVLTSARRETWSVVCLSRIREMGSLMGMYALSHDDRVPSALDPNVAAADRGLWLDYVSQVYTTFPRRPWLDFAGFDPLSETQYCPGNQLWPHDLPTPSDYNSDFVLSASLFMEAAYADPNLPEEVWRSRLGAKVQRIGAAHYPSQKAGIMEYYVWHGWTESHGPWTDTVRLTYFRAERPGSVWFLDGHARPFHATEALPFVDRYDVWYSWPLSTTAWGIAGRDR